MSRIAYFLPLLLFLSTFAAAEDLAAIVDQQARAIEPKVIGWRRHLHEHPELSNREVETGKYIAAHLRGMCQHRRKIAKRTGAELEHIMIRGVAFERC